MKNKIEYDKSFNINLGDFTIIGMGLKTINFCEKKIGVEYFYKRGDEIIRMRNTDFICDISFKNVDSKVVEITEREYKIKCVAT